MDTPPYGCFTSTRGESVDTVGKNPVRPNGSVAPDPFERTDEPFGKTLVEIRGGGGRGPGQVPPSSRGELTSGPESGTRRVCVTQFREAVL